MTDATVIDYGRPRPTNRAAVASLLFGLMLFVPLVTGVLAIALGRRGMRAAREAASGGYRIARAGLLLGVINVILTVVAGTAFGVHEHRKAQVRECASNLQELGM